MQKKDFVSLAEARPDLAAEWNYEKNGDLRPEDVTCKSGKKVWWKLPYDVPMDYKVEKLRGKHFEFEWEAAIIHRNNGRYCPYLSGRAVWKGFNDLQTVNSELAKQWHPAKNGNLSPSDVTANSNKLVWWIYQYKDLITGKYFNFEWQAIICNRNKGVGCPYLTGNAIWPGFNDLQTVNPELAKQWHPVKNGNLKPSDVMVNSGQKVWWLLPYDDIKTGKHFDFEWQDTVNNRNNGYGCPFISGHAVWPGFNDLQTINPELAKQWHPIKNGHLKPLDVTANSGKKVWWLLPYDDIETGKHFDFEWQTVINSRHKNNGCPYLSGKAAWPGFNDLQTVNPELATQWHPIKNGNLKPTDVTIGSNRKVWWLLPYDDIKTGKHFNFEWQDTITNRIHGYACPYLSGHAVWKGFNDLQTTNPELAKQWHPTKNSNLKPTDVTAGSDKKVWWLLPYDDIRTGKHFDFEWQAKVNNRVNGRMCPYLSGKAVWLGFNDLQTANPELAKQWHPTKNSNLKPTDVTAGSDKKVWWLLPYDDIGTGKHFDFEWQATISHRNIDCSCPYLSGRAVWKGFNDLQTVNPELAKQWHPTKNGNLKPTDVTSNSNKIVWWMYKYDDLRTNTHFNFEWQSDINSRNRGNGCPYLNGRAVWKGFNDLQTINPELAKQWHPTKNGNLKPADITSSSGKKAWWLLPYDDKMAKRHFDFEWQATIYNRNNGTGCPYLTIYKGEEYIKQYLQKNNIAFIPQQKFPDLIGTGGGQLSYDFSIPSVEKYGLILIEYNGIQHYESSDFFGGDEQLKKQKEHDRLKKEYAKKHGYKLIIVKYTYDTYENVAEYLEKELKKSDESVFDLESKTRLHQTSNGDSTFFADEMNGEYIKTAEKEVIKESTEENKENIGKIEEKTGESIAYNKEENVA